VAFVFKKPLIAVVCVACGLSLVGAGLGYTVNQAALFTSSGGDPVETSRFFFPALSLLSGAVLAAMGAIALAHRWRGIR
jgi:hypothetical protein